MALFRRRKDAEEPPQPDEDLTFLDVHRAARLRALFAQVMRERGLEVTVHADHVVDSQGRRFGLWNVGTAVADEPEGAWRELVTRHVEGVLSAMDAPSPFETMTSEQVRAGTYVRLVEGDGTSGLPLAYAEELVPGVRELLALDLPETIAYLNDEHVAAHGGLAALHTAGRANLARLARQVRVERLALEDGAAFEVVMDDSLFTASLVVVLPELLARAAPDAHPDRGVLVAMPFRHQVALHAIHDGAVVPSLNAMIGFARNGFADGTSPLTPHVYWWRQGLWTQLTHHDEDGGTRVLVTPQLQEVFEAIMPELP